MLDIMLLWDIFDLSLKRKKRVHTLPSKGAQIIPPGSDDTAYNGFVTSDSNQMGLAIKMYENTLGGGACCRWEANEHQESYPNIVHGGLSIAVLDDLMAHAIYKDLNVFPVTVRLKINFSRALKTNRDNWGVATLRSRHGRFLKAQSILLNDKGVEAAKVTGTFYVPTKKEFTHIVDLKTAPKSSIPFFGVDNF
ncbi:MAG: acyl-coenzyme A thioesterase PaaI-like protein [Flavobacteriales bacterium]|jgi:acyl-coenzyme A thioesterase PaaI-like protein